MLRLWGNGGLKRKEEGGRKGKDRGGETEEVFWVVSFGAFSSLSMYVLQLFSS